MPPRSPAPFRWHRILETGFSYDGSGNPSPACTGSGQALTADGVNTMTGVYPERARKRASRRDAESRTVTTSGTGGSAEYKYDAQGLRVKKCVPDCANPTALTISIYAGEEVIAEYNGLATPPSLLREFIYYGDQLLAIEEATARRYMLRDHLSVRVTTNSSGTKIGEQGHYPYGEDWYLVDTTTERLFTTYQREAESGNDYAIHRYHASSLGRFTTADPVHGASAAPQQLNRYAYVGGDPVNRRDPRGLYVRRDCSSFELPLGQSCAILPQTDKGGGGGSPMDIPWDPGGAEPPLPGLLPGGGFGYSGGTNGGYWGPAGPASSAGPMSSGWGSGLFDEPGDEDEEANCEDKLYACVENARQLRDQCEGNVGAGKDVCIGICAITCLVNTFTSPVLAWPCVRACLSGCGAVANLGNAGCYAGYGLRVFECNARYNACKALESVLPGWH